MLHFFTAAAWGDSVLVFWVPEATGTARQINSANESVRLVNVDFISFSLSFRWGGTGYMFAKFGEDVNVTDKRNLRNRRKCRDLQPLKNGRPEVVKGKGTDG
jgi:hypothetical protein